jgi:two-component system nitrogen regulation response regulator NtrX
VPPLRERKEDIPFLVERFLKDFAAKEGQPLKTVSDGALQKLMGHDWPGNVRELKNIVERLIILTPSNEIRADDLPELSLRSDSAAAAPEPAQGTDSLRDARLDFERQFIIKKLEEFDGNISRTAEAIGLERSNLHKKLKSLKVVTKDQN